MKITALIAMVWLIAGCSTVSEQNNMAEICQPEKAYKMGLYGRQYHGQCAGVKDEDKVVANWKRGYEKHTVLLIATDSSD